MSFYMDLSVLQVDGCCSGDGVVQTVSMRSSSDNDGQRLEGHQKIYAEIEATSSGRTSM